jgi:hypothetical protein
MREFATDRDGGLDRFPRLYMCLAPDGPALTRLVYSVTRRQLVIAAGDH